jgi:hypothetical protein
MWRLEVMVEGSNSCEISAEMLDSFQFMLPDLTVGG